MDEVAGLSVTVSLSYGYKGGRRREDGGWSRLALINSAMTGTGGAG